MLSSGPQIDKLRAVGAEGTSRGKTQRRPNKITLDTRQTQRGTSFSTSLRNTNAHHCSVVSRWLLGNNTAATEMEALQKKLFL
jgi:hypothetical protein